MPDYAVEDAQKQQPIPGIHGLWLPSFSRISGPHIDKSKKVNKVDFGFPLHKVLPFSMLRFVLKLKEFGWRIETLSSLQGEVQLYVLFVNLEN